MTIEITNRSGVEAPEKEIESLLTFGLDYTGTDIDTGVPVISPFAQPQDGADRIVARVRFSF